MTNFDRYTKQTIKMFLSWLEEQNLPKDLFEDIRKKFLSSINNVKRFADTERD